jgi:cytoskeletal protein RodZ
MSDLGALLRKAREQKGYSLDDVQEATKIRKRYLEAIETGDYKVLPGSFYVRAFVKTYAETVGLDAEEVLRLYQKELPQPPSAEQVPKEPMIRPSRRSVHHSDRWGKVIVSVLMWAFPVLIGVVIYVYVVQHSGDKPNTPEPTSIASQNETSPSAPATAVSPPASTTPPPASTPPAAATLTLTKSVGSTDYYDVGPAGVVHKLQIETSETVWIGVQENSRKGKYLLNKTTTGAETFVYELTGPLYVNVGSARKVTLSIDGVIVNDGDIAGSKKFLFTPQTAQP